jgi:hypothetical protein
MDPDVDTETELDHATHRVLVESWCVNQVRAVGAGLLRWLALGVLALSRAALNIVHTLRRLPRGQTCSWLRRDGSTGPGIPVEVLLADRGQARRVRRMLRNGLKHLQYGLGSSLMDLTGASIRLSVLAQLTVDGDGPLAGSCHLWIGAGGQRHGLLRLALEAPGRPRSGDEVLATLAEQFVLVATHRPICLLDAPVVFAVALPTQAPSPTVYGAAPMPAPSIEPPDERDAFLSTPQGSLAATADVLRRQAGRNGRPDERHAPAGLWPVEPSVELPAEPRKTLALSSAPGALAERRNGSRT